VVIALALQTLAKRRRDNATRAARAALAAAAKAEKEALEAEAEAAEKDDSDEEEEGSVAQTGVCARDGRAPLGRRA
jgi:hypothetical protein